MPLDFRQIRLGGSRGEKVDTARMLLVAEALYQLAGMPTWPLERLAEIFDIPTTNEVPRIERATEALNVWGHYPREFLEFAYRYPPAWHLLTEPTRWEDVDRDEVVAYFQQCMEQRGSWPTIGALRARFGRTSNHRPEAEKTPGQDQLGGVL